MAVRERVTTSVKPPKVIELSRNETLSSFLAWKGNLTYNLALNPHFAEFLGEDARWVPRSENQTRGFLNLLDDTRERRIVATGAQRAKFLDTMLGMIAGYAPIISRNIIVRDCRSIKDVFHKIRAHYGFAQTGSSIIDSVSIAQRDEESPEDVYQRIHALIDSSLLTTEDHIRHLGNFVPRDEEVTPTLSNLVTCLWLKSIHPGLPNLVKQKYATQLKNCTITSIREEISSSIPEMLSELNDRDHSSSTSVFQASSYRPNNYPNRFSNQRGNSNYNQRGNSNYNQPKPQFNRPYNNQNNRTIPATQRKQPSCPVCRQAGRRNFNHFMSACSFLPEEDRRFLNRARLVECLEEEANDEGTFDSFPSEMNQSLPYQQPYQTESHTYQSAKQVVSEEDSTQHCLRVTTSPSPFINAYYKNQSVKILLDTGATVNLINERLANHLDLPVNPSTQTAKQADGISDLDVKGETRFKLVRDSIELHFEGLIVRGLESEILAGIPFMSDNDISIRPSKDEIMIGERRINYDTCRQRLNQGHCKRVYTAPIICSRPVTLFPSDSIDIACNNTQTDGTVFVEPCNNWLTPEILHSVDGKVRVTNSSDLPVMLESNQVIATSTTVSDVYSADLSSNCDNQHNSISDASRNNPPPTDNIEEIKFNPQNQDIEVSWKAKFNKVHRNHSTVFEDGLPGYNGKFGTILAYVNIGDSLPPQRRGKIPQYSKHNLVELQNQIDQFEEMGVFATPEESNTYAEYINPTFLVKKPNSDSLRLVTSFGEVAAHSKPTPTLASNVDEVLREFGRWKYIIKTDLRKAYYQIPLHEDSRKYCAIVSPFKGVRVYCRAAMGMPGSECALDELMARMLGDLIQNGDVKRVADDIYAGSSDIPSLLAIWEEVLNRLQQAGLRLSPSKTEVLPSETTILGWIWREGKLSPSPHHTAALSICDRPTTIKGLRSYLGAYKVVSRCLKHCSRFIAPLESLSAGKESKDLIPWDQAHIDVFKSSQQHLKECSAITIPSPSDKLWLITDASSANLGIAATLVSTHPEGNDPHICSFFSAKLKGGHNKWLPCEIECLAIASAINHFRPFIIDSNHRTTVLTDSKPACQAYQKFLRGEFSSSSRMQSFLLAATQNNVILSHIRGVNNSLADFGSRNSVPCNQPSCSVCKFIDESAGASVSAVSIKDIVDGTSKVPFNSPSVWLQIQLNCPTVQLARKHLQQGTRPMKKQRNIRNVKQLLRVSTVKDGLLVVQKKTPLQPLQNLIVVPEQYAPGLITAMHLQLNHPSTYQLQQVFNRQFYTINSERLIQESVQSCHQCKSLQNMPKPTIPNTTSAPYNQVGSNFAADIIKRNQQKILVLCEEVTKYTQATFVESEQHTSILQGLKALILPVHPPCSPIATIKVDPAPGMQTLYRLQPLKSCNILLELGEPKNKNKLATIDKQIQELENEFVRLPVSKPKLMKDDLAMAVSTLNSRIRSCGLSSYEQWHRRNQFDKSELPISDESIISYQSVQRNIRNASSAPVETPKCLKTGSIVYIISEKTKHNARPRYLVDKVEGDYVFLRKFSDTQLRCKLYKIHRNACTMVSPSLSRPIQPSSHSDSDSDNTDDSVCTTPVDVPDRLSTIPTQPTLVVTEVEPTPSADTSWEPETIDPVSHMDLTDNIHFPPDQEQTSTTEDPLPETLGLDQKEASMDPPILDSITSEPPTSELESHTAPTGRPQRIRKRPVRFGDYVLD